MGTYNIEKIKWLIDNKCPCGSIIVHSCATDYKNNYVLKYIQDEGYIVETFE